MAIDPGTMQQMLMQRLAQGPQAGTAGGGQGGPQMQGQVSPQNAAASLAQKAMLIRALQAPQIQQQQANSMLPGTNAQMAADPTMQALQQSPQMPPVQMPANPAIAPPFAQPTPGFS
jgi:hypothetical protein